MDKYPECEKMAAVADKSQTIGEFLEWAAGTKRFNLCICTWPSNTYGPIGMTTEELLAEFFDINLKKVEKERREMLEDMREHKQKGS